MRGNETFKEMDYEKTNDQWNGVVPDSFDVHTAWPQCSSASGSGIRALAVRAGPKEARKSSMTGAASPRATAH